MFCNETYERNNMFEIFGWSYLADAVGKLPKEAIYGAIGAYVVLDIHKRNTEVKIAKAKAETRAVELEVEALRLKLELKQNPEQPQ